MKIIFLFIFFGCIQIGFAQSKQHVNVVGMVKDTNGHAIAAASILLNKTNVFSITNQEGFFKLTNIAEGSHTLIISSEGFKEKRIQLNISKHSLDTIIVELVQKVQQLNAVTIAAYTNTLNPAMQLNDITGSFIAAGKKNVSLNMVQTNTNYATKIGRQLFAKVPGAFVYDMDGSGNQLNIATRGLDPHRSWEYNVRQNDVLLNSDMYGYPASHYSAHMESIEKVNLIHGTAALQYGAQFGGIINYITKQPDTTKAIGFENLTTAGSFGLWSTYNALSGKVGKFSYYTYMSKRISDGYRKNNSSNADNHFVQLQYDANEKLNLKIEFGHSKYVHQLAGPLNDSMFHADPQQATRSRNWYSPDIYVPSFTLNWKISKNTSISFISSAVLGSRNSVQFIGFADKPDLIDVSTGQYKPRQVDIDHFNSYTQELKLKQVYTIASMQSVLVAGVQLMNNSLHRTQLGKGTTGSDFNLELSTPGWGRDLHFKTNNLALFAENILYITPAFSISPGFRFEQGNTNMKGLISYYETEKIPLNIRHRFPLFGINTQYKLKGNNRLYAGISQAYRPMIFKDVIPASSIEVIDQNLKDAYGYNAEMGLSGNVKKKLQYDLSLFHITYNNRIGGLILKDNNGNDYQYKTNIGNSSTNGIEVYLEYTPLSNKGNSGFSIFTATSYMHAVYVKGLVVVNNKNVAIAGNKLEAVPEWITRNGINAFYKSIVCSFQYSYVSQSFSDAFNTITPAPNGAKGIVPAYGLMDMNISFKFLNHYQLRTGVNNIANKQHFTKRPTFYPDPGIWPSDGRNLYLSFGLKF